MKEKQKKSIYTIIRKAYNARKQWKPNSNVHMKRIIICLCFVRWFVVFFFYVHRRSKQQVFQLKSHSCAIYVFLLPFFLLTTGHRPKYLSHVQLSQPFCVLFWFNYYFIFENHLDNDFYWHHTEISHRPCYICSHQHLSTLQNSATLI